MEYLRGQSSGTKPDLGNALMANLRTTLMVSSFVLLAACASQQAPDNGLEAGQAADRLAMERVEAQQAAEDAERLAQRAEARRIAQAQSEREAQQQLQVQERAQQELQQQQELASQRQARARIVAEREQKLARIVALERQVAASETSSANQQRVNANLQETIVVSENLLEALAVEQQKYEQIEEGQTTQALDKSQIDMLKAARQQLLDEAARLN
ncbi:MAG: hypothetical protein COC19_05765 [SAR86 cluster bacterium]|uniref:Uncharacterized protein n=1 Tax=SAR86 cluster bacterium TaxID=2030880 RepID=A0A2A4MK16_9GAMM|nr:MAG: hypothetical protein COC19_05765 [SAR86 cluster bacterium]